MTIKAILTDIEGTTTSVSFVYDILFPYFKENIDQLLNLFETNEEVASCFQEIKKATNIPLTDTYSNQAVIKQLKQWVEEDVKDTNLKQLQGILWANAYHSGEIKGHLYPDVEPKLSEWKSKGLSVNVYSSGSVAAQKLLFGHSVEGDLRPMFDHYFDTNIGHKRESSSYQNIAMHLGLKPNEILFLSDIEEELNAAKAAGFDTTQLVREGTAPGKKHRIVTSFDEL